MLGYASHSMANSVLTWESVIHPEDYPRVMAHFEAYITQRNERYLIEYRCRCQDGSYLWVEDSGYIIARNSDGSVASNGRIDDSEFGRGKGEWTGDNSSTAASFMLVYSPNGRPSLLGGTPAEQARHQQIGFMRPDASVETGSSVAANNVNLLVQTVLLNYLALHGEQGRLSEVAPFHGLGNAASLDRLTAFAPIR